MSYIGATPLIGNFQKCDAITTSATDTFNLLVGGVAVSPATPQNCVVSLNGVIQAPTSAYTVSGSTIVFDSALTTSDVIDFIIILGNVLDLGTPSDDTVTAAKLNDTAISGQTALGAEPADTDEFLVSDAGVLKRMDYSYIKGGGKLGQVIQTTFETQTVDTTADHDIMTMASITPASSSSRFLININLWCASGSNPNGGMILYRDSTALSTTAVTPYGGATGAFWSADEIFDGTGGVYGMENFVWSYIDSPATASAIVYKLSAKSIATMYYNRPSNAASNAMSVSTMIVSELLS